MGGSSVWCGTFYNSNFSAFEQDAVLATTKTDEEHDIFVGSENILSRDKVFFLSAEEAEKNEYGFLNDSARIAIYGDSAGVWWLRPPDAYDPTFAGAVHLDGNVDNDYVLGDWAARPAFNLNLNAVLFTSAADENDPQGGGCGPADRRGRL